MLPAELARQIHLLEIRTDHLVEEITGGAYRSIFKGRGIEFDEVREYTTDDDVRMIDWNVSARMGSPYVKKFVEERELSVMLAVDLSASGAVGAADKSKRQTAAELAALLAFSAGKNGDFIACVPTQIFVILYIGACVALWHRGVELGLALQWDICDIIQSLIILRTADKRNDCRQDCKSLHNHL